MPAQRPAATARWGESIRRHASWLVAVALMSLGEDQALDRLLFRERSEFEFVLRNVHGVLDGSPAFDSFRQRVLGPALVVAIERVTRSPLDALELFFHGSVFAINFLLFVLLRRNGASKGRAVMGVGLFGFARVLLTYRLEYPWDEVDLLLFAAFGYAASRNRPLRSVVLLLLIGTLNHETVLYIPLWYMIAAAVEPGTAGARSQRLGNFSLAATVAACIAGAILWMRRALSAGPPLSSNQFHLTHNLGQFLVHNWAGGRAFISITLSTAVFALLVCRRRAEYGLAAWWSLSVIGAIFCFGYVNETRLYLCLLAFWIAFAWQRIPGPPAAARSVLSG